MWDDGRWAGSLTSMALSANAGQRFAFGFGEQAPAEAGVKNYASGPFVRAPSDDSGVAAERMGLESEQDALRGFRPDADERLALVSHDKRVDPEQLGRSPHCFVHRHARTIEHDANACLLRHLTQCADDAAARRILH